MFPAATTRSCHTTPHSTFGAHKPFGSSFLDLQPVSFRVASIEMSLDLPSPSVLHAGLSSALSLSSFPSPEEETFLRFLCFLLLVFAASAAALLLAGVTAPYGRYSRGGWGPLVPARVAWIVQESPVLVVSLLCWRSRDEAVGGARANAVLLALLCVHYFRRTFVYPLQIRGGKPTPFSVAAMAFLFCLLNGYIQARSLTRFSAYPPLWTSGPRFQFGVIVFFAGMALNSHSDAVLVALRKDGEGGYRCVPVFPTPRASHTPLTPYPGPAAGSRTAAFSASFPRPTFLGRSSSGAASPSRLGRFLASFSSSLPSPTSGRAPCSTTAGTSKSSTTTRAAAAPLSRLCCDRAAWKCSTKEMNASSLLPAATCAPRRPAPRTRA